MQVLIFGHIGKDIDNAEDRHKFSSMLDRMKIDQPKWKEANHTQRYI